jgi:hypothetical protein
MEPLSAYRPRGPMKTNRRWVIKPRLGWNSFCLQFSYHSENESEAKCSR